MKYKSKKLIILVLAAAVLMAACGGSGSSSPAEPTPSAVPTAEQMQPAGQQSYEGDYEVLWEALERGYPYLPYLEEQGTDLDGLRRSYAAELEFVDSEDEFYALVQSLLGELRNFAHLNLITPEMYQSYYYIYVLNDGIVSEEYSAPFEDILLYPALSERYQPPESAESYEAQKAEEPGHGASFMYYSDCKALYIKLPSFSQELVEKDSNIVYAALEQYPDAEHVIFDISVNGGGSDLYWMNNLVAPFGGQYEFRYRNYYRSSDIFDDYYSALETSPAAELADAPEWVESLGLDRYMVTETVLPYDSDDEAVRGDIKRWVLTSDRVFSASDKFTCFCKATGWATVVGSRTAGDGLGATPVLVLLPDSGLLIRFSYSVGENPDGTINAAAGSVPDIICVKGESPLERCLETIRGK